MDLQVHCPEVLKTKVNLEILLRSPRTTVAVITWKLGLILNSYIVDINLTR